MKSRREASSSTSRFTYDVFLSFSGKETRKTFTDHLYTALKHAGFRTFRDDDGLERGEDIKSEQERAIRESRISIIVFSKSYASSTWCLDELVMILKRRAYEHAVLPVFYDVDPSEVRKQIGSFGEAFARHEEKLKLESGEGKEELKEKALTWRAALRDVADLSGMNLRNQADGNEARFIQKIVNVVGDKVSPALYIDPHLVGIHSQVKNIQLWVEDESSNVGIVAICGMGGIGKTTMAKFLYNLNSSRFEASSFLENVRESSQRQDGLLRLQRQLLSDILKTREVKLNSIAERSSMIKDTIHCKRVFLVLDDVDKLEQLDSILGMRDWLFRGSKIIITTRREQLLRANEFSKVHRLENLANEESLELFSWHAFGKCCPDNDYEEVSKRVVGYCGGLPLALKVLGSSLSGQCLNVWENQLDKLETFPVGEVVEKLRISYDSLQDERDKHLFVLLACFFVGSNVNNAVKILDACEFYTMVGIQNLVDRCLISIDGSNNIVMHHLLQETAREVVLQDSPKEPGERRILWNHKDAFNVLRHDTGTSRVEALKLDMCLLKEDKNASTNLGCSPKRYGFNMFSSWLEATCPEISNQVALEAAAFRRMHNLKILLLNHVYISGSYKMLPKGLRWLCWREFPFKSIPNDFPLESLVVLEMLYSNLKYAWEGTKFLVFLKILNLSHSPNLATTPDFTQMPNLESLLLENCASLVKVHESIGCLEKLVLLNLKDCKSLKKLPRCISMLKRLETLVISGCSNLEKFRTNMGNIWPPPFHVLPSTFPLTILKAPDKQNSSKQDLNSRGEEDSERLQLQMQQHSDATFSISNCERTSCTAPEGVVSYMRLNEMGEAVAKRQKLSTEDNKSLTRRETDEISNSSKEEFMEEMWSRELKELNSYPMEVPPTISHHFTILHILDLSYTEIKSLPQSISRLVALQKLYLRSCERLMQLPPEIGELANLEVLDLEGTEILCLPKEIAKLVKLTCLRVSFYGYANQTVIPRKVLSNLSRLNELIIDVTPYGEWWDVEVEAIIDDLRTLKELRALKLYLPTAELLEGLTLIFPGLANFRFTVGRFEEHFISRLPRDVEEEFNNQKKLEKGLKYVNGDRIPNEITKVFKDVNAFFLQCHWTANSLSEFGHENLNEVKFCLVMECNEFQTIIDSEQFYQGNDGRAKFEDFQDFDEAIVLGSLERLIVCYMKNMESIWKGPVGKGSMSSLKSLALHTCPNLTTLFTIDMLSNLINLEELIVEDCPKIDSLVSLKNSYSKSGLFLPSLKKISLLELPGLVSISSGLCIAPKLERMVIFYCPKLEKLSAMDMSSTNLKVIKGEEEWWNALKWYESDLSTEHEDYLTSLFIPLRRNGDLFAQLTED